MGTIGNGYSFAHAKYGANPKEKHIFRDQLTFLEFGKKCFGGHSMLANIPLEGNMFGGLFLHMGFGLPRPLWTAFELTN